VTVSDPSSAAARSRRTLLAMITSLVVLSQLATSLYIPSLPSLGDALQAGAGEVKLTMTIYLLVFAVAQLVYGPLADRFGRRRILIAGLAIYLVGSVLAALAPSIGMLILARGIQAAGACALPTATRASVRDRFDRSEATKVMALIGMAMAVGPALGPILGGQLQVLFGWRAAFAVLALLGAAAIAMVLLRFPETAPRLNPAATQLAPLTRNYVTLLSSPVYVGNCLAVGFCFWFLFVYTTGAPFVLIEVLGMSPDLFGVMFIATVAGYVAGMATINRLAGRVATPVLMGAGVAAMLLAAILMLGLVAAGHVTAFVIVGAMTLATLGLGMVLPTAMSSALAPFPMIAGVASAGLGFTQMGMASLGSLVLSLCYDGAALSFAAIFAVGGVGATLSYLVVLRAARGPR